MEKVFIITTIRNEIGNKKIYIWKIDGTKIQKDDLKD